MNVDREKLRRERIRAIAREEIASVLRDFSDLANDGAYSSDDTIDIASARVLGKVASDVLDRMTCGHQKTSRSLWGKLRCSRCGKPQEPEQEEPGIPNQ